MCNSKFHRFRVQIRGRRDVKVRTIPCCIVRMVLWLVNLFIIYLKFLPCFFGRENDLFVCIQREVWFWLMTQHIRHSCYSSLFKACTLAHALTLTSFHVSIFGDFSVVISPFKLIQYDEKKISLHIPTFYSRWARIYFRFTVRSSESILRYPCNF